MGADASSIVDKMGSDMSSMINETSAIIFGALSQSTDDHDFDALRRVKIFVGLSDVELKSLIDEIKVLQYRPGSRIFAEGLSLDQCFIVKQGQCVIRGQNKYIIVWRLLTVLRQSCVRIRNEYYCNHGIGAVGDKQENYDLKLARPDAEVHEMKRNSTAAPLTRQSSLLSQLQSKFSKSPSLSRWSSGELGRSNSTVGRQNSLPSSPSMPSSTPPPVRRTASFLSYLKATDETTAGIRENNLKLLIVLGKGSYGRVTLAKHKKTKAVYALKALSKCEIAKHRQQVRCFREKNNLLACKQQPFIVNLHSTFKDSYRIYMLMEYVPGGNLSSLIEKGPIAFLPCQFYSAGIVLALEYLTFRNVAHRDLKADNILIDAQGYPKLTDFGFSKVIQGKTFTICGTPKYLAPEVILEKGHDCGVDYWALGVLLYEMRTGHTPFEPPATVESGQQGRRGGGGGGSGGGDGRDKAAKHLLDELFRNIADPNALSFPKGFGGVCQDITTKLLTVSPEKRLGNSKRAVKDVKKHAWFAGLDFSAYHNKQEPAPWVPSLKSADDSSHFKTKPVTKEELKADDSSNWDIDF